MYTDENEECVYHPGPPIFHEGQKGRLYAGPAALGHVWSVAGPLAAQPY